MLILRTEVDKKVNDLLMREVRILDWSSVPSNEFETIEDRRLKYCPVNILTNYPSSYFSTEIKLDIFTRLARGMKCGAYHTSYNNSEKIRNLLENWVSYDFLKDNLERLVSIIDTYSSKTTISTLYLVLVSKGLLKFTDVNIELCYIYQNYYLVVPEIKQDTWIDLCKNTNYIHEMYTYEGGMSDTQVLPLTNEQLRSIGLCEIKNHSLEKFRKYSEDAEYYSDFFEKHSIDDIVIWDKIIEEFYNNNIGSDSSYICSVLDEYWKFALSEQNVIDPPKEHFKNESRPHFWTRLDL